MSDQPQKLTGEQIDKARDATQDYLQDNPDQARSLIDKVEDAIDERTGGKFSGMVDKAGDWAEEQLNLPEETPTEPTDAEAPAEPTTPAEPKADPVDAEAPAGPTTPAEAPTEQADTEAPAEPNAPTGSGDTSAPPPLKG